MRADDERVATLERELVQARASLVVEREARTAAIAEMSIRIEDQRRCIEDLLRRLYGRKSEKLDPRQLALDFGDLADGVMVAMQAEPTAEEPATSAPDDEEPVRKPRVRRRPSLALVSGDVPTETIEILPEESERCCPDCADEKERIGEEISEEYEYEPARIKRKRYVRIKLACRRCESHVSVAPTPQRPIPRCTAGPGLLAHVLVSKYADHLPLYRQEKMLSRLGIGLARSTLCDWVAGVAKLIRPLVAEIRNDVLASGYVRADETPIRVSPCERSGRTDQCYLWSYLGGGCVVFDFTRTRARDGPNRFLADFLGYLQCDGYVGYDEVAARDGVVRLGCNAHVRRHFHEAFSADPAGAAMALGLIQRLYVVEREAEVVAGTPEDVVRIRQERAAPVFDALDELMPALRDRALPQSALGKAVTYYTEQRPTLSVYLTDGRLGIDNNPVENQIRPVAVGRKNWLFAGSPEGGHRAAAIYTVLGSAKLAGVNPQV